MVCGCFLAHERDESGLVSYFRFNDVLQYNYNNFSHGITFENYKEGATNTTEALENKPSYTEGIKKFLTGFTLRIIVFLSVGQFIHAWNLECNPTPYQRGISNVKVGSYQLTVEFSEPLKRDMYLLVYSEKRRTLTVGDHFAVYNYFNEIPTNE